MPTRTTRLPTDLLEAAEDEAVAANALLDARIAAVTTSTSFADRLAARGVTTVGLDESGAVVRRHPDGTTTPL